MTRPFATGFARGYVSAHAFAALMALCFVGCGGGELPVAPVVPPEPTPVIDPGPVEPPAPVDVGNITEAQFAAVTVGEAEGDLLAALGPPFRSHTAATFTILTYVLPTRSAFVWISAAGKVDHTGSDR